MGDLSAIPLTPNASVTKVVLLAGADIDCIALTGRCCLGFAIGTVGTVAYVDINGDDKSLNLSTFPSGFFVEVPARKIKNTGTTATVLVYLGR